MNDQDEFDIKPKTDDDQMMGRNDDESIKPGKAGKRINAEIDWSKYVMFYDKMPRTELLNNIAGILLQTKKTVSSDVISQYADAGSRENFIKTATIQIMSTPEYQLC
jgi:hypothetical protein